LVEHHLNECEKCQKYLSDLQENQSLYTLDCEREKIHILKLVKQKIKKKNIIISIVSVVCTIAIICSAIWFIGMHETPVPYKEGLIDVKLPYDGVLDAFYKGNDYYCVYGMSRATEEGKNNAYIYYTDTIFTRNFSKTKSSLTHSFSIGNSMMIDFEKDKEPIVMKENIDAIYYLIGDYTELIKMDKDSFGEVAKDAVLLWHK